VTHLCVCACVHVCVCVCVPWRLITRGGQETIHSEPPTHNLTPTHTHPHTHTHTLQAGIIYSKLEMKVHAVVYIHCRLSWQPYVQLVVDQSSVILVNSRFTIHCWHGSSICSELEVSPILCTHTHTHTHTHTNTHSVDRFWLPCVGCRHPLPFDFRTWKP